MSVAGGILGSGDKDDSRAKGARDTNLMEEGHMTHPNSAKNQDPTLDCAYVGGPRDGFKTGDLPALLSGKKLTGAVSRVPLSQPAQFSLYAVYVCTSDAQV